MDSVRHETRLTRVLSISIVLGLTFGSVTSLPGRLSALSQKASEALHSRRMTDGKQWTTRNLNVKTDSSYCYDDAELNCSRYGRLYTWDSARQACESLGHGWRLPTNDEWQQLAEQYGGLLEESPQRGRSAFKALVAGGRSGFNAVLGGGRDLDGQYARLNAHGFYWTASESGAATAWLYNFGKGMQALNRHSDGEKQRAFSVRCVRE
ncbi:MAG TPA: FISUMP domain-containing protein [Terriglobales bacterium]|nr:FISUMP domain-containing protein [Terriglobales bacterium]